MSHDDHKDGAGAPGSNLPFEAIVGSINEGILIVGLDASVVYANRRMAEMLGFSPDQMIGRPVFDFMTEEWAEKAREALRRRRQGIEEVFDHQWKRRDGRSVWTLVSAKPMYDADGEQKGSLVAIQDISTRKRMEQELREARDELERRVEERTEQLVEANEKLKEEVEERREAEERALAASRAKSAFLANMSHELRTPLNAVIGYTELVEEELNAAREDPESLLLDSLVADLGKVQRAANHLLDLINDILDLSKVEAGKMDLHLAAFDLGELASEVAETIEPLVEKNENDLELNLHYDGELTSDRTKLKQVLINLVGNAAKFTDRGRIEITTERASVADSPGVRIDVVDTGVGIPKEEVERLFEPFTQVDESTTREHGGTGLGLTICRRFCEMLGGYIEVESTDGEGTTVSVYLPSSREEAGLARAAREVVAPRVDQAHNVKAGGDGPILLVIDDDPDIHELMRRFLEPRGYRVYSAFGGDEGLQLAAELDPDVITLDVMMPERDGWSVLSNLKADVRLASIPVVMVTMIDDKSIGYALEASDYLVKPIERERLVGVLSRFRPSEEARALVVEDEESLRELMTRHLKKAGWQVETAENGRVALDKLDERCPDVVILDLMMPQMDGFEVADIMRQEPRWKEIPIVVVTAIHLDEAEKKRLEESVERILKKEAHSIEEVLTEVLEVTGVEAKTTDHSRVSDDFADKPS